MKKTIAASAPPATARGAKVVGPHPYATRKKILLAMVMVMPPAVCALTALLYPASHPRPYDMVVFGMMWVISFLGIAVGYHRFFTHQSFKCGPAMTWVLGAAGSFAANGPVIPWVATHRKHHSVSDREGDPHSPHLAGSGLASKLRGFAHAHMGWLADKEFASPSRYARDLLENPTVMAINRHYLKAVVAGVAVPALGSQFFEPGWAAFFSCLIWGGLFRIVFVQQLVFSVNSFCHLFGTRPYAGHDESRNNALLALPTFGEAWHNNHHRFPKSAYSGLRWWEVDISGWLISLLHRCGLIRDVVDARKQIRNLRGDQQPGQEFPARIDGPSE